MAAFAAFLSLEAAGEGEGAGPGAFFFAGGGASSSSSDSDSARTKNLLKDFGTKDDLAKDDLFLYPN